MVRRCSNNQCRDFVLRLAFNTSQRYCCVMSVGYSTENEPEKGQVPALTWISLSEFLAKYSTNAHRARLVEGLLKACAELRRHGCNAVYVGGSFVDNKTYPDDYDACFDTVGLSSAVDPIIYDDTYASQRKEKYLGDWKPARLVDGAPSKWLRYFAEDRQGNPRCLFGIKLNLKELIEK